MPLFASFERQGYQAKAYHYKRNGILGVGPVLGRTLSGSDTSTVVKMLVSVFNGATLGLSQSSKIYRFELEIKFSTIAANGAPSVWADWRAAYFQLSGKGWFRCQCPEAR